MVDCLCGWNCLCCCDDITGACTERGCCDKIWNGERTINYHDDMIHQAIGNDIRVPWWRCKLCIIQIYSLEVIYEEGTVFNF